MSSEVLVLNQDYEPLNVSSLPRAFRLVLGGKAELRAVGPRHPLCDSDIASDARVHAPS